MILAVHASTGVILYANPATERLLGYTPAEIQGQPFPSICAPEAVARSAELIADAWEQGGAVSTELRLRSRTGEKIPVEVGTRVAAVGKQPAIILYIRDIRERLRLQRIIEEKNQQLIESIQYARRLQLAALPPLEVVRRTFPASFLLYMPRDIVSGDFYWVAEKAGIKYLAVGDCTGHGVPGAMMVMLSLAFLNQAVQDMDRPTPAQLLTALHQSYCATFANEGVLDGSDVILIAQQGPSITWASANRPLWYQQGGEFCEIKGERAALGAATAPDYRWQDKVLPVDKPTRLFLTTDGYADQFGGPQGRKLTTGRLKRLLAETAPLAPLGQEQKLRDFFAEWKGELEQVDDVLVARIDVNPE